MMTTLGTVLLAGGPGWGPGWSDGGGPGWWLLIPIVWGLVWLAVIVTAVVWLWRRGSGDARAARSVLAERFARGDITEQEYTERRAVLHRSRRRAP